MRLIDADDLADALFEKRRNYPQWVADTICKMPDAVVRCKNCRHYDPDEYAQGFGDCLGACDNLVKVHENWFCADGEV